MTGPDIVDALQDLLLCFCLRAAVWRFASGAKVISANLRSGTDTRLDHIRL